MSEPAPGHPIPPILAGIGARHGLGPARVVWINELGGVTAHFPVAGQHLKWAPIHRELDLVAEADRLRWASAYVPVPEVLEVGADAGGQWLRTRTMPGRSAVDRHWIARPEAAARAIGEGLRRLHDTLPVEACPYSWSLADRFAWIHRPEDRALMDTAPPVDRLVVCHGDACAPNTLIGDDGRCSGHVDLGHLGVADRWADLSVATNSLAWNFPGDHQAALLEAYGVEADEERISYYRRLWDAT